jgi:hypothetical protein
MHEAEVDGDQMYDNRPSSLPLRGLALTADRRDRPSHGRSHKRNQILAPAAFGAIHADRDSDATTRRDTEFDRRGRTVDGIYCLRGTGTRSHTTNGRAMDRSTARSLITRRSTVDRTRTYGNKCDDKRACLSANALTVRVCQATGDETNAKTKRLSARLTDDRRR